MSYKDKEYARYYARCYQRTRLYGNWRRIYYEHDGVCKCGSPFHLEFHEEFSNESLTISETYVILLCPQCHAAEHPDRWKNWIAHNYKHSQLAEDIEREIQKQGSLHNWLSFYGID